MKNKYIIQFETITGKTLFLSSIAPNCVNRLENHAFIFTNKKEACHYAKYFLNYVLSERSTYKLYKIN